MASLSDLQDGLVKADAAGNSDDAKVFADAIRAHPDNQPGTTLPKAVDATKMTPVDSSPLYRDTWQLAKNVGGGLASSVAEGIANYGPMSLPSYLRDVVRGNMPGTENKPLVEAAGKIGPAMGADPESTSYKVAKQALPMLGTAVATGGIGGAIESALPSFLGRAAPATADILANAGVSGAESAGESASQGKPVSEIAQDFLKGAAYGGGGAAAGRVVSKGARAYGNTITEPVAPAAKKLMDAGISVTPAQAYPGGLTATIENMGKLIPGFGGAVEKAQARTGTDYVRHFADDTLSHIGQKSEGVGLDLVDNAYSKIDDVYNRVTPQITLPVGRGNVAVNLAKRDIDNVPLITEQQVDLAKKYLNDNIEVALRGKPRGASLSGEEARGIDIRLGDQARKWAGDVQSAPLSEALYKIQGRWRSMYESANPTAIQDLSNANASFRKWLPLKDAVEGSLGQGGTPSTLGLRQAVQKLGQKPDELNKAAVTVLPNRNWAAERRLAGAATVGAGFAGGAMGVGTALAGLAGASALGHVAASRPVISAALKVMGAPAGIREWASKLPYADQVKLLNSLSPATQAGRIIGQQQENQNAP